jgi:hypothetical protein
MLEAFNSRGFYEIESGPSLPVNRPEHGLQQEPETVSTTAQARTKPGSLHPKLASLVIRGTVALYGARRNSVKRNYGADHKNDYH